MYKIMIFTLLLNCFLFANESGVTQKLSYNEQIALVHSIKKNAIVYGSGEHNVYVFIDPLCKYSRKFISMVSKNKSMLSKYKYYLYLYEIPRLHSHDTMTAIYKEKDPLELLLDIMLDDDSELAPLDKNVERRINEISKVAKKLNINKRPFLIIEK